MRSAFAFLTVLGRGVTPSRGALRWFPVVGLVVGAAVGVCWWGLQAWFAPGVVAALTVTVDACLTGFLHYDGLADSGDGLLPPLARQRRLEVMRAPDVGAFGAVSVMVVLLVRWSSLATLVPGAGAVAVTAALWAASRSLMAVTTERVPYARADEPRGGLASVFCPGRSFGGVSMLVWPGAAIPLAVGLAAWGSAAAGVGAIPGAVAVLGGVAAGCAVLGVAWRRVGGFTGDVLGAAGVVAETVGLLLWTARW